MIAKYETSLIDFEGKLALLISTQGCNYDCWFCFSSMLKAKTYEVQKTYEVLEYLRKTVDHYQAIVVTGGEPTIWEDRLVTFLETLNTFGLPMKLDTNGSRPRTLEKLLNKGLLTVVAMDIKHDLFNFERMAETIGVRYEAVDWQALMDSIAILSRFGNVQKIYRTTLLPTLHEVHFIKILRTLERYWDDNSVFHLQWYDYSLAETPLVGEEPDLEAYERILSSFGFRYRFKNF